jgi:hypothetical protein
MEVGTAGVIVKLAWIDYLQGLEEWNCVNLSKAMVYFASAVLQQLYTEKDEHYCLCPKLGVLVWS